MECRTRSSQVRNLCQRLARKGVPHATSSKIQVHRELEDQATQPGTGPVPSFSTNSLLKRQQLRRSRSYSKPGQSSSKGATTGTGHFKRELEKHNAILHVLIAEPQPLSRGSSKQKSLDS